MCSLEWIDLWTCMVVSGGFGGMTFMGGYELRTWMFLFLGIPHDSFGALEGLMMLAFTLLQRLTLTFFAMDVLFAAIRFLFLCLLVVGCCLCYACPGFLCYISRQDPALEVVTNSLPKYKFEVSNGDVEQPNVRTCRMIPKGTNGPEFSTEHVLQTEDAHSISMQIMMN